MTLSESLDALIARAEPKRLPLPSGGELSVPLEVAPAVVIALARCAQAAYAIEEGKSGCYRMNMDALRSLAAALNVEQT